MMLVPALPLLLMPLLLPPLVLAGGMAAAQTPATLSSSAALAPPVVVPGDPFADVYAALLAAGDEKQRLDLSAIAHAQRAIAADPALARIDDARPGLTADLAEALRPVLERVALRLREAYRDRTIAAVRDTFTPAEAADMAAFLRLEVGRKLVAGIDAAYQSKAIIAIALSRGMITPDDAKSGAQDAARDAFAALTPEDYELIGRMAEARPALQKINLLSQRLGALRVAMEQEPLTAPEKLEADAAIKAGVAAHAARLEK